MKILAVDTATYCGGIAVIDEEYVLASLILNVPGTHSRRLMKNIDFLLKECRLSVHDISGIGVSMGPGSFTGVRIGMACAKGLSFSTGKPLLGISTLKALALHCAEPGILLCPVMDARRSEIFGAAYRLDPATGELHEIIPGRAQPLDKFLENIKEPALFCGDGSVKFADNIKETLKEKAFFASLNRNLPSAVEVAMLALQRLKKGDFDDTASLAPLYLRMHDARLPG